MIAPVHDIKLELEMALAMARLMRDSARCDLAGIALIIRHLERVIEEIERQGQKHGAFWRAWIPRRPG